MYGGVQIAGLMLVNSMVAFRGFMMDRNLDAALLQSWIAEEMKLSETCAQARNGTYPPQDCGVLLRPPERIASRRGLRRG